MTSERRREKCDSITMFPQSNPTDHISDFNLQADKHLSVPDYILSVTLPTPLPMGAVNLLSCKQGDLKGIVVIQIS